MSVIVDAVVAGAAAGGKDVATAAVKEAYGRLKEVLVGRLAARPQAGTALAEVEAKAANTPDEDLEQTVSPWRAVLEAELIETGAATANDVLAAAQELLALLTRGDVQVGPKYQVDVSDAHGVQVGDHGAQNNTFGSSF